MPEEKGREGGREKVKGSGALLLGGKEESSS